MTGYIYIIKNRLNNKVYVGQTLQRLNKRIRDHFSRKDPCTGIGRAVNKHGRDNFEYSVLKTVYAPTKEDLVLRLNKYERLYIGKYQSFRRDVGYNYTEGGDSEVKKVLSEESKLRISISRKTMTLENKENYRRAKLGENNPMYGKSGSLSPVSKPVDQYDKSGNYIATFISATEAGRQLKISQKNISTCCTGKLKSAGGYLWKHSN